LLDDSTLTELHQIGVKGAAEKKKDLRNCSTYPEHHHGQEESQARVLGGGDEVEV